MDLLKAEIERKRRAVSEASKQHPSKTSGKPSQNEKRRYLKASELREFEERQLEEEEEALRERQRRRQEKRRKKRRRNGGEDEDEDNERESQDLTTLLTKKYNAGERRTQLSQGATGDGNDEKSSGGDDFGGHDSGKPRDSIVDANEKASIIIPDALKKLNPQEVTNALRSFGLPVRLFGEKTITTEGKHDDSTRLLRLAVAMEGREAAMLGESEKDEFRLGSGHATRNIFLERDSHNDDDEGGHRETKPSKGRGEGNKLATDTAANVNATSTEEQTDPPKKIYRYFKSLIRQWEDDLALRPDSVRRTAAGRNETKTLKQCKDYIRPLFQLCKSRQLEPDLENHLFKIVTFCEQGEFVKAHDAYMDVAIGRAAWPIGVTMVGIHARSGRAKIESANVAHVMNSELHRKYLTSVKRLMSYAQKKRPDVDPSKKVMNL